MNRDEICMLLLLAVCWRIWWMLKSVSLWEEVQYLALRPCSFSEFLGAIGKNNLLAVLSQKAEYTVAFHEQLMHLFNQYTIVGGMPEAVQQYAETQDVIGIEDVYELWCKPIRMILRNTSEAIS